ncbi:mobile mystery protein A, partial [Litorivicinus sp.]|nr:mobile mystery protein A [Litorivicinus sp.]
ERFNAREHLDSILERWRLLPTRRKPNRGWVRAIREALGMTTTQLSSRLGVSQSRVVAMEVAEQTGSLTIKNLARAANALDCELVYALVPRHSLQEMVEQRVKQKASNSIAAISHSMMLEGQAVADDTTAVQLEQLIQKMKMSARSDIWEGE